MAYADAVLADSPAGYWKLQETSGTSAVDASGNGNNATYTGGYTLGDTGPFGSEKAVKLDAAIGTYIEAPDSASLSITGDLTLEAWFKRPNTGGHKALIGKTNGNQPGPWDWYLWNGSQPDFYRGNGSSGVEGWNNPTVVAHSTWYYLVVTHNLSDNKVKLYYNAVQEGADMTVSATIADSDKALRIGSRDDEATRSDAWYAHVAVYASVLTPTRITAHYNARLPAGGPPFLTRRPRGMSAAVRRASSWMLNSVGLVVPAGR